MPQVEDRSSPPERPGLGAEAKGGPSGKRGRARPATLREERHRRGARHRVQVACRARARWEMTGARPRTMRWRERAAIDAGAPPFVRGGRSARPRTRIRSGLASEVRRSRRCALGMWEERGGVTADDDALSTKAAALHRRGGLWLGARPPASPACQPT
jgi:hypothetical protein